MMFDVMNRELRSRILQNNAGIKAPTAAQLTELLCLVDPMRFAIASYRHHVRPEAGLRFLRRVLDGAELHD